MKKSLILISIFLIFDIKNVCSNDNVTNLHEIYHSRGFYEIDMQQIKADISHFGCAFMTGPKPREGG